jgi:hypothetical protein
MVEDIHARHQQYLAGHGGRRKFNNDSTHHKIEQRIERWHDRWDLLEPPQSES